VTGHRRRKPGTPTARKRHHDNARELLHQRLAEATDPLQRLHHGFDYLRGAAERAGRRDHDRDLAPAIDAAVAALVRAGDRLIR
jgi:hypothetical protein